MIPDTIIPAGTKVKFYGHSSGGEVPLIVTLDGKQSNAKLLLSNTDIADRLTPVFSSGDLQDGDHEFIVDMIQNATRAMVVDYFECVVSPSDPYSRRNSPLINSSLAGLRIRREGASIFSGLGLMRRTCHKKLSL